jgi:hypothetical protein
MIRIGTRILKINHENWVQVKRGVGEGKDGEKLGCACLGNKTVRLTRWRSHCLHIVVRERRE